MISQADRRVISVIPPLKFIIARSHGDLYSDWRAYELSSPFQCSLFIIALGQMVSYQIELNNSNILQYNQRNYTKKRNDAIH